MKASDLFESKELGDFKQLTSSRTHRLTIKSMIEMRKQREKRKLDRLKDQELYYQMYAPKDDGGDMGGF